MSLRAWLRRIRDSVKQEGAARSALRALASPTYRAEVLRARPLRIGVDLPPFSTGVRLARREDLPALAALNLRRSVRDFEERLAAGDDCLLLLVDGSVAGYMWASMRQARLSRLALPLRPDEMFSYEMYIHPAHRRRRLPLIIWPALEEWYRPAGVCTIVNAATLGRVPWGTRIQARVAVIRTLRLGPFRKFWVKNYGPEAEYWRERLRELRWA